MEKLYITDPARKGRVTCHKCDGLIVEGDGVSPLHMKNEFPPVWFHLKCYNGYEHYYGLDKPID